jgi:hypothetical protein
MRYSEIFKTILFVLISLMITSRLIVGIPIDLADDNPLLGKRFVTHTMKEIFKESIESYETEGSVQLSYPEYIEDTSASINDSIASFICQYLSPKEPSLSVEEGFDKWTDGELRRIRKQLREIGVPYRGTGCAINIRVITDYANIFGIEVEDWGPGIGHPREMNKYANFEFKTGRSLNLEDLLVEGYKHALDSIGEIEFKKVRGLTQTDNLSDWSFQDNKFSLNTNFLIDTAGLIFYFNVYEIAGYADGPTSLTIDYNSISMLIRSDGPLPAFIEAVKKAKP